MWSSHNRGIVWDTTVARWAGDEELTFNRMKTKEKGYHGARKSLQGVIGK